jgi:hypothetical protein
MLTIARTVPIWTLGRLGLRRVGSGRRWVVVVVPRDLTPDEERERDQKVASQVRCK